MNDETQVLDPVVSEPISSEPAAPDTQEPILADPISTDPIDPVTGLETGTSQPTSTSNGNLVAVNSNLDYSVHNTVYNLSSSQSQTSTTNHGSQTNLSGSSESLEGFSCGTEDSGNSSINRSGRTYSFSSRRYFHKKASKARIDRITDFSSSDGDMLALDRRIFKGIGGLEFKAVDNKQQRRRATPTGVDIIYQESTGKLYFNANGDSNGYGSKGGLFCVLENTPLLSDSQFIVF